MILIILKVLSIIIAGILLLYILILLIMKLLLKQFSNIPELYINAYDVMCVLYDHDPRISKKEWLNLGLWHDSTVTYEEACDNLARKLADDAEFCQNDIILDAGCGTGTSSRLWFDYVKSLYGEPPAITGLNISPHHIEKANNYKAELGYGDKLNFKLGDATDLKQFGNGSFSKIAALECAFHFNTREKFFKEAFRVLKDGGKLVLSDLIVKRYTPSYNRLKKFLPSFLIRPIFKIIESIIIFPIDNQIGKNEYISQLTNAGFTNIRCETINDRSRMTIKHYKKKLKEIRSGKKPDWIKSWDSSRFKMATRNLRFTLFLFMVVDNIVVVADKQA
jgi:ubiquinone/menaquinone biosynthesis C-methylase UbiE